MDIRGVIAMLGVVAGVALVIVFPPARTLFLSSLGKLKPSVTIEVGSNSGNDNRRICDNCTLYFYPGAPQSSAQKQDKIETDCISKNWGVPLPRVSDFIEAQKNCIQQEMQ